MTREERRTRMSKTTETSVTIRAADFDGEDRWATMECALLCASDLWADGSAVVEVVDDKLGTVAIKNPDPAVEPGRMYFVMQDDRIISPDFDTFDLALEWIAQAPAARQGHVVFTSGLEVLAEVSQKF